MSYAQASQEPENDLPLPLTPLQRKLDAKQQPLDIIRHQTPNESWRAFSLRWPYQLFLLAVSLVLLAAIETLRQISNTQQGLAYYSDSLDIPRRDYVAFNFLPTILGVLYSILWSFVDTDAKRLEPYFQMRQETSPASNLVLDYLFESPFVVPFRAIWRKHWNIGAIASIYLLISLALPASQGALLGLQKIALTRHDQEFMMRADQENTTFFLEGDFVDQAKALRVPDSVGYPSWVTDKYAIAPFYPSANASSGNETWTANTTIYYAEPSCRRFEVESTQLITPNISGFDNGYETVPTTLVTNLTLSTDPVCKVSVVFELATSSNDTTETYWYPLFFTIEGGNYVSDTGVLGVNVRTSGWNEGTERDNLKDKAGYWRDPLFTCPSLPRFTGLIKLTKQTTYSQDLLTATDTMDTTFEPEIAMFACSSDYLSTSGLVTVKADTLSVLSVDAIDKAESATIPHFNSTAFEWYLDWGIDPSLRSLLPLVTEWGAEQLDSSSVGDATEAHNTTQINTTDPGLWAIYHYENLATLAIANISTGTQQTPDYEFLLNDNTYARYVQEAYQAVFALAYKKNFLSSGADQATKGTTESDLLAVAVNPIFSVLSEVLLILAILVLLVTMATYPRRQNVVRSDPDSIAAQCSLVTDMFTNLETLDRHYGKLDQSSTRDLEYILKGADLEYDEKTSQIQYLLPKIRRNIEPITKQQDRLPILLTKRGIVSMLTFLFVLLAAAVALLILSARWNGFKFLSEYTTFASQLFWSFMPGVIATFVESVFVALHRDMSMLECWVRLRDKESASSDTISLRYSSRPPTIVLYLAVRKKHWLLAFLSFLCLTTSIFNVSMAGLFSQDFVNAEVSRAIASNYTNTELPSSYNPFLLDMTSAFGLLHSHLSASAKLPAWTTTNLSLVPLTQMDGSEPSSASRIYDTFNASTIGIGASLNCSLIPDRPFNGSGPGLMNTDVLTSDYTQVHFETEGAKKGCDISGDFKRGVQAINIQDDGIELDSATSRAGSEDDYGLSSVDPCSNYLVISSFDTAKDQHELYLCTPAIYVGNYAARYNAIGEIISSAEIGHNSTDQSREELTKANEFMMYYFYSFRYLVRLSRVSAAFTDYDWMGFLMTRLRSSEGITSIPDLANEVFARTFATWFSIKRDQILQKRSDGQPSLSAATETALYRDARIVGSTTAFAISISLLVFYIIGYLFIIALRRHTYTGPRLPKTIGSIIPWVIESRMLGDFEGLHYLTSKERRKVLMRLDGNYAFGRFRAKDGRVRLGIEYEEHLLAQGAYEDF